MDKIEELLTRGVANIIPSKEGLEKLLRSKKQLNVYLGIDPTATHIHLGHAVPLRKLQLFSELGHNVTFLIGDFTALIGDTSDKDSERPALDKEQIQQNFQTYKNQAERLLDFSKIKIRYNSEWLKKLTFEEIIKLCQHFSFGDFANRELIRKRLQKGKHVGLHEALYPVMQGYDSHFMDTDIQIGGTDQTFNMQAGRILQRHLRNNESYIMTNVFLEGTDGRKMSKTWGNAIWLDDKPYGMYAKVMAIKDDLIIQYYTLATNTPLAEIQEIEKRLEKDENPRDIKKELAYIIVNELHSEDWAQKAQEYFERTVQQKELPTKIPSYQYQGKGVESIVGLLVMMELATSRSDAKRLVEQGGVEVENERITDPNQAITIDNGMIIKVGKRKIVQIATRE